MWFQQKFYQGSASGLRMSAWRAGYTDVCWMGSPFLALSMSMNRLGETPVALLNTMDIEWYRCRPTSTFWSTPDICWRNPPDIWWQTWFKVVFYILGGFTFPKQRLSVISEDKMLEASDGDSVAKTSTPTMCHDAMVKVDSYSGGWSYFLRIPIMDDWTWEQVDLMKRQSRSAKPIKWSSTPILFSLDLFYFVMNMKRYIYI
jgi:hypothetical protein